MLTADRQPAMTAEQLGEVLQRSLAETGVVNALKSQLRNKIISRLHPRRSPSSAAAASSMAGLTPTRCPPARPPALSDAPPLLGKSATLPIPRAQQHNG